MLAKLLGNRVRERGISVREASRQIGVAHTTIIRIMNGKPADIDTLEAVCKWMGVKVSDVLEVNTTGSVASKIALLVERIPALGTTLTQAVAAVEAGDISDEDLREIVQYAMYKIGTGNANRLSQENQNRLPS